MKQAVNQLLSNQELMPGVYLMWLESPEIARQSQPGQFVMVACGEDTILRRPISVHSVDGDKLALLYMIVGKGTEWLTHLKKDDSLDILGPLGNGFKVSPETKSYLFIAGGIGIAPLRFLAEKVKHSCRQITVLHGAQTEQKLYPKELLPKEVSLITATNDGTAGHKGFVTDLIPTFITTADEVFICGPMPMLGYIAEHQKSLRLEDKPVSISLEMRMGCALGVCYGCTIRTNKGTKQVCKDGPVFNLNEVVWDDFTRI
ncbi:MAG: dihydroorotate dehydrogenase electron transfer subunit [Dehalococcoidales bacterium]|nr:dihydroorotate dehydrogenase electron transfer subunit [Dehalococcoidales bacterium]